jgi:phosphopantetheinyl transferase
MRAPVRLGTVYPRLRCCRIGNAPLRPDTGVVHVWMARLAGPPSATPCAAPAAKRRSSIQRFQSESWVRSVLAGYLRCEPSEVPLARDRSGKPFLDHTANIRFSVSHAEGRLLIAVTRSGAVGVDLELTREANGARDVVDWLCRAGYYERPDDVGESDLAALAWWTSMEAQAKAMGVGIAAWMASRRERELRPVERAGERWSFANITPWPDVVATVALRSTHRLRPVVRGPQLAEVAT